MSDAKSPSCAPNWTDNSGYTHLELYPDGTYKSFVPEIDTEWMVRDACVKLKASCLVTFHPNGALEECVLGATALVNVFGVPALVREDTVLSFRESGEIRRATLASQASWLPWKKGWSYRGALYAPGTEVELDEGGTILRAAAK